MVRSFHPSRLRDRRLRNTLARCLLAAAAAVVAVVVVPGVASAAVRIGIADNKPAMFSDPRFAALRIGAVRIDVRWDVLRDPGATAQLDAWMAGAQRAGARPLVTFDRSPARPRYTPSAGQLVAALRGLRARYPFVSEFSTWNEANISKQPAIVARWYRALSAACRSCLVLGADLLDRANVGTWARRFVRAARRQPPVWGLHNYVGANRLTTQTTMQLLRAVGGRVWFTETGGLVGRRNASSVPLPASPARAARVTRYIFDRLATLSPRIERVYVYNWNMEPTSPATWDSALIGPDGAERPALEALRGIIGRGGRAPRRPTG
jgi:hypothetical protein